jgi:type II secretory pathway component PulF
MRIFELEDHLPALILYTQKLSALIDAGVSLQTCFGLLERTTDDPVMSAANAYLRAEVIEKNRTMSEAMADRPTVFSPFYIAFVKAGEIGGVLDEAFAHLVTWLEREREAADRLRSSWLLTEVATKVLAKTRGEPGEAAVRTSLPDYRRVAQIASFCRLFEMCLTAGVPRNLALTTAAQVLGEPALTILSSAVEKVSGDDAIAPVLSQVAELRPVIAGMAAIGEECGLLDQMLRRAADFYDAEAVHILHAAVGTRLV